MVQLGVRYHAADLLAGRVDMDRFNQKAWQQLRQMQMHLQRVNVHAANEVMGSLNAGSTTR
jgi:hypothetical protein